MNYNTNKKGKGVKSLTPEQRTILADYHNARLSIPPVEELIKKFNLPTTKQNVFQIAARRRGKNEE